MDLHEQPEPGVRWGAAIRERRIRTIRVYAFDRACLSPPERQRIPEDAHVEVDSDGCAFLAIGGERLLFAGDLPKLLRTLDLPASSLRVDDADLLDEPEP